MSGAIDHLHPEDDVVADKGFDIQDDFSCKHTLFSKGKSQFCKEEMAHKKKCQSKNTCGEMHLRRAKDGSQRLCIALRIPTAHDFRVTQYKLVTIKRV